MSKTWCEQQNKKCDYLDKIQKCNYEKREGTSFLDCRYLTDKCTLESFVNKYNLVQLGDRDNIVLNIQALGEILKEHKSDEIAQIIETMCNIK